jgi:hypothetical protein
MLFEMFIRKDGSKMSDEIIRCEGWERHGGMMTLGRPKWTQCENEAVVILEVIQDNGTTEQPVCIYCWNKGMSMGIKINSARPIGSIL